MFGAVLFILITGWAAFYCNVALAPRYELEIKRWQSEISRCVIGLDRVQSDLLNAWA